MTIDQMLAAIAIFRKYIDTTSYVFHAEHDTLHGPHEDELANLTDEDRAALESQGWMIGSSDCWEHNCSC